MLKSNKVDAHHDKSLDILDIKMQQSLDGLNSIYALLNNKTSYTHKQSLQNQRLQEMEKDWFQMKTKLASKETQIDETKKTLQLAQNECVQLQQRLDNLTSNYDTNSALWKNKYTKHEETLQTYKHEMDALEEKNKTLEEMIHQLREPHEREMQRNDQFELLLKENAKELKITTNGILERDRKIEEFQQNIQYMQQMMDEKNELLENYDAETQLRAEEYNKLQDKCERLEEENLRMKRRLSNLNELYHNQPHPETHSISSSRKSPSLLHSDNQQLLPSKVDSHISYNRRDSSSCVSIPSTPNRSTTSALDDQQYLEEINVLKEKLMEKISQNRELESVMERINKHSDILRTSLNESREESANRYRKMLGYMEEIRILKQELDYVKNASI
jgi:chromosome segregation ATPase